MEVLTGPPNTDIFFHKSQNEPPTEKMLATSLREMSNIIVNHQTKMSLVKSVKYTLETNSDIINTIPDFVTARDMLSDKVKRLCSFYEETRQHFIDVMLQIAESLKEYGVMTENSEVIEHSSLKKDLLLRMGDKELVIRCASVFKFARTYLQSLYLIGNMKNILSGFESQSILFSSTSVKTEDKSIYNFYNKLYSDVKEYLCITIDKLVNDLKEHHPGFYIEYKSSRLASSIDTGKEKNDLSFEWSL